MRVILTLDRVKGLRCGPGKRDARGLDEIKRTVQVECIIIPIPTTSCKRGCKRMPGSFETERSFFN